MAKSTRKSSPSPKLKVERLRPVKRLACSILFRHAGKLEAACFAGEGLVITKPEEGGLVRWSLATGAAQSLPRSASSFAAGPRRLVGADRSACELWVLDLASGEVVGTFPFEGTQFAVPNGNDDFAIAVEGRIVFLLDFATGERRRLDLLPEPSRSNGMWPDGLWVKASTDGRRALVVFHPGLVPPARGELMPGEARVYDVAGGTRLCAIPFLKPNTDKWLFDPGGRWVVVECGGVLSTYDAESGALVRDQELEVEQSLPDGAFVRAKRRIDLDVVLPSGEAVLLARSARMPPPSNLDIGRDETALVDLASGRVTLLGAIREAEDVSRDGRWLLSTDYDSFEVRDARTGVLHPAPPNASGHTGIVQSVAFVGDGEIVSVSNGQALVWDVATGKVARTLVAGDELAEGGVVNATGRHLVGLGTSGFGLWEVSTGRKLTTVVAPIDAVAPVALDDAGKVAVLASPDEVSLTFLRLDDEQLIAAEHKPVEQEDEDEEGVYQDLARGAALTPDGKLAATTTWYSSRSFAFTSADGKLQRTFDVKERFTCLAFSPDGKRLVAGGSKHLVVVDGNAGEIMQRLSGVPRAEDEDEGLYAIACASDMRLAAAGGSDGTVHVWNLKKGAKVAKLEGHDAPITALAFDTEGRHLASGDEKGNVLLWELSSLR